MVQGWFPQQEQLSFGEQRRKGVGEIVSELAEAFFGRAAVVHSAINER